MTKPASIFGREADLGFYVGGSTPFFKMIGNGPNKWLLLVKKLNK
jgi:hypothetical protein